MRITDIVSTDYRGLTVALALDVGHVQGAGATERDQAGARVQAVLARAAQSIAEYLVVATQDLVRDELVAALKAKGLAVTRIAVGDVGPTSLDVAVALSFDPEAPPEQREAGEALAAQIVQDYKAAHAAAAEG